MTSQTYSPSHAEPWLAPVAAGPLDAAVELPGSKSLNNRELVLSALADSPTLLTGTLASRDSSLMMDALRALGTQIDAVSYTHLTLPTKA